MKTAFIGLDSIVDLMPPDGEIAATAAEHVQSMAPLACIARIVSVEAPAGA